MEKTIINIAPAAAETPRTKRVAAYARVSCGKDTMLHSLAAQIDYYRDYIIRNPEWRFAGVYADEAKTGTKDNREQFQLLLTECRNGNVDIQRIQNLESLLAQNTEQRETLTKLMAQGYIDQILYNSESNALMAQADGFRDEINAISGSRSSNVSKVTETEQLLHFAEHGSMVAEFDELLFAKFVDNIRVDSRRQISFILKCGLTLQERIDD